MDYEKDIAIDETALDVEWLDQSARTFAYCKLAAEAHRDMDLEKERVDYVKAQLDQAIRSNPKQYGIAKMTEGTVQAAILTDEAYQETMRNYLGKKYEYEVAQGAVRAFDHRKSSLENLVRLQGQSYFAGPSVPHDLSELRRQRDARVNDKVAMRLRRKAT